HRRMPRPLALTIRRIAGVRSCAANGKHERGLVRIVWIQAALSLFEARFLRPGYAEGASTVPQPLDRPAIGFRHHPEEAGLMAIERFGDGEVGRKGQGG